MLLQNGGGMLQGDRYRIDIHCRAGSRRARYHAVAGKLYKCEENYITQVVNITAEAGQLRRVLAGHDDSLPRLTLLSAH